MFQIIGLIFSAIAAIMVLCSTITKTKKKIFIYQCIDSGSNILANLFLQGYSGMITSIIALIRNVMTVKEKIDIKIQILLCILATSIGLLANNYGFIGLLPIVAFVEYTLIATNPKSSVITVKTTFAINVGLWAIYNFIIQSYPMFIANVICLISCIISIIKLRRMEEK